MAGFIVLLKNELNTLPKTAGVYAFYSKNEVIYIGKAINIQSRVKNHFQQPSYRDDLFMDKVEKVGYLETGSEIEALVLEASLIKKQQPKFNVVWRDDKNYFYVAITKGNKNSLPIVYITHQPEKLKMKNSKFKTSYIGPFVEGTALKKTLKFLRRAFPFYTTTKHPKNKCTWCHLGLCPGPNPDILQYKKDLKKLALILQGKRSAVLNSLRREMKTFSDNKNFEKAGEIRDRITNLQQVMAHRGVISSQAEVVTNLSNDKNTTSSSSFKMLEGLLNIEKIYKIECYDVSNIQGKLATGSMVSFVNGESDKNQYRKFKIKMENEPNDIAMLNETLTRRFAHSEWPYPEIILIDGGIAQLNIAIKVKNELAETKNIKVLSLAKREKDLYIESREGFIPLKSLTREIYNLILQLDDEAHRFAITYHKKLRRNDLLK